MADVGQFPFWQASYPDQLPALSPGQAAIGAVGCKTVTVGLTPAVTTANAYGTNYVVGGLLNFQNAFTKTGSGILESISVNILRVETSGFTIAFFSSFPSITAWTDASVAAINARDVPLVLATVPLGTSSVLGTHTNLDAYGINLAIQTGTTNLYAVLTANAALTNNFVTINDVSISLTILQDP
jgi:hypothetical protein